MELSSTNIKKKIIFSEMKPINFWPQPLKFCLIRSVTYRDTCASMMKLQFHVSALGPEDLLKQQTGIITSQYQCFHLNVLPNSEFP